MNWNGTNNLTYLINRRNILQLKLNFRSTYATNTIKVAAICPEYSNEIQKVKHYSNYYLKDNFYEYHSVFIYHQLTTNRMNLDVPDIKK